MPELPDVCVYVEGLEKRLVGHRLLKTRIVSPFVLRSYAPPLSAIEGKALVGMRRIGKRVVFCFEGELFLVTHLMIAGRFRWFEKDEKKLPQKTITLAVLEFESGTLVLTEASKKKRASLMLVESEGEVNSLDPGGVDVFECGLGVFKERLQKENHTLKRVLTDPRVFSGIGNAYSDEILNAAGLSPIKMSQKLADEEIERLYETVKEVLEEWLGKLREEFKERFPGAGEITAFRPDFSVHGKYGKQCGRCETEVQRIRYAETETNYCPRCQTGGKLLADRSLSRILKKDWPKTIEELELKSRKTEV
ncbi:MAG: DNA-formamidopyrimidine glycosylase family protein [Verrucomicrobiota bacterium]